jgi:hypothetical protein
MLPFDWEGEGHRLGTSLDFVHAIAIVGDDPGPTARVALGVARAQVGRRRVAIADLLGDCQALQELVEGDDPHGLSDSFTYGVSLNRIARPARGVPGLFILPTGTEPIEYDSVLPSERWGRLAAGFREADSLLLLVAPSGAPGIEQLVQFTDGAVLVGSGDPGRLTATAILARIREPEARVSTPDFGGERPSRYRLPPRQVVTGVGLALVLVALGLWLVTRPMDRSVSRPSSGVGDSADVLRGMAAQPAAPMPDDGTGLTPANEGDSVGAAAFSVDLKRANTQAGAILLLEEERAALPAATFAPEVVAGGEWFTILGGAYADSAEADSLLRHLRDRGTLDAASGGVSRRPLAFILHGSVRPESANSLAAEQRRRGIPAYALRQSDGTAVVYAGAFSSPETAGRFAAILRAAGIAPTLVYRTGRVF